MPLKRSPKHEALRAFLKENPTNNGSDIMNNRNIIPTSVLDRVEINYINYNTSKKKSIIGDYTNNMIACYGSTGYGSTVWSLPSSDDATFGGSGTDGAIPIED
jgi:hypothetical protein